MMQRHLIEDCREALRKCRVLTSTYHMPTYTSEHLKTDLEAHVRRYITRQIADLMMQEAELQINETPPDIVNDPGASTEYRMTMVVMTEEDCVRLHRCLNTLGDDEAAMDRLVARLDKRSY